jgi:hypothetical protein
MRHLVTEEDVLKGIPAERSDILIFHTQLMELFAEVVRIVASGLEDPVAAVKARSNFFSYLVKYAATIQVGEKTLADFGNVQSLFLSSSDIQFIEWYRVKRAEKDIAIFFEQIKFRSLCHYYSRAVRNHAKLDQSHVKLLAEDIQQNIHNGIWRWAAEEAAQVAIFVIYTVEVILGDS